MIGCCPVYSPREPKFLTIDQSGRSTFGVACEDGCDCVADALLQCNSGKVRLYSVAALGVVRFDKQRVLIFKCIPTTKEEVAK
jgi:hypothetical protein